MDIPRHIYDQASLIAGFAMSRLEDPDSEAWLNAACDAGDYLAGHYGYTGGLAREFSAELANATMREWERSGYFPGWGDGLSYARNAHTCVGGEGM